MAGTHARRRQTETAGLNGPPFVRTTRSSTTISSLPRSRRCIQDACNMPLALTRNRYSRRDCAPVCGSRFGFRHPPQNAVLFCRFRLKQNRTTSCSAPDFCSAIARSSPRLFERAMLLVFSNQLLACNLAWKTLTVCFRARLKYPLNSISCKSMRYRCSQLTCHNGAQL